MVYQKYVYWLQESDFLSLKDALRLAETDMYEAKKAPCVPLAGGINIGFVPPDAWERYELCKRQMSWYQVSSRAGQTLVVSSFKLDEYGLRPEAIIKQSKFRPPSLPDEDEKKCMRNLQGYQRAKPKDWEDIDADATH